jgi:quinol monooxygenase YgiN
VGAKRALREPGVARFDLLRQNDDETRFVLVEV